MKRKKGYTLVELIVTFALIALFMSCAAMVVGTYMKIHTHTRDLAQQQVLADTLLDDVQNKLSKCVNVSKSGISNAVTISDDGENGHKISFYDENYYPITICINPGKEGYPDNDTEGSVLLYIYNWTKEDGQPAKYVYWSYPDRTYLDNKVTKFNIAEVNTKDSGKVVYEVSLTLESLRTKAKYTDTRYIECANLEK